MSRTAHDLLVAYIVWRLVRWRVTTPGGWLCIGLIIIAGLAGEGPTAPNEGPQSRPYLFGQSDAWRALRLRAGAYNPIAETYSFSLTNMAHVGVGEINIHCDEPRWIGDEIVRVGEHLDDIMPGTIAEPGATTQVIVHFDSNDLMAAKPPVCRIVVGATAYRSPSRH